MIIKFMCLVKCFFSSIYIIFFINENIKILLIFFIEINGHKENDKFHKRNLRKVEVI